MPVLVVLVPTTTRLLCIHAHKKHPTRTGIRAVYIMDSEEDRLCALGGWALRPVARGGGGGKPAPSLLFQAAPGTYVPLPLLHTGLNRSSSASRKASSGESETPPIYPTGPLVIFFRTKNVSLAYVCSN